MKALSMGPGLMATAIAFAVLPSAAAAAEYLVPPDNSAAIQYTETYPSAGGHKDAEGGNGSSKRPPAKVLGAQNAQRLEQSGPDGEATAQIAAETAPTAPPAESASPAEEGEGDDSKVDRQTAQGAGGGNSSGGGGAGGDNSRGGPAHADGAGVSAADTEGSSGLGETIAQAFGAPSGDAGILLPLAILGALAWSLTYLWRQRKRPAA